MRIRGQYRDVLVKNGKIIENRGWRSNSIAADYGRYLAALMKKEVAGIGIEYMAVGGGSNDMTSFRSNVETFFKDNVVKHDTYWVWAKEVKPEDMIFLDDKDDPAPAGTITNRLQIDVKIEKNEPSGESLVFEQFALLGIDDEREHMFLINYVDHGPITKDISMELERTIKLEFPAGGEQNG